MVDSCVRRGTSSYDHPVNTNTSLLRLLFCVPDEVKALSHRIALFYDDLVNPISPLLRQISMTPQFSRKNEDLLR